MFKNMNCLVVLVVIGGRNYRIILEERRKKQESVKERGNIFKNWP
jgi:hypothetical protein